MNATRQTDWTGPGEDLSGREFWSLTVESFARVDEHGVRVLCRCSCGRVAVRYVVDLHAGRARACARCQVPEHVRPNRPPLPDGAAGAWAAKLATDEARCAELIARVDAVVQADVVRLVRSPRRREMHILKARAAALRRIARQPSRDIARHIDRLEVPRERIYAWVRRGLPVVLGALERWRDSPKTLAADRELATRLIPLFEAGRSDEGRPRPERWKHGRRSIAHEAS